MLRLGRDHAHRNLGQRWIGRHRLGDLPAVHHGHHQVEQDDARCAPGHDLERDLAVLGGLDAIADVAEHVGKRVTQVLVIVDDEHAGFLAHHCDLTPGGAPR